MWHALLEKSVKPLTALIVGVICRFLLSDWSACTLMIYFILLNKEGDRNVGQLSDILDCKSINLGFDPQNWLGHNGVYAEQLFCPVSKVYFISSLSRFPFPHTSIHPSIQLPNKCVSCQKLNHGHSSCWNSKHCQPVFHVFFFFSNLCTRDI